MNLTINIKIICFYLLNLLLFLIVDKNEHRLIGCSLLYIFGLYLFKINWKLGLPFFAMAVGAAITEHIFIKYMKNTWSYKTPDIGEVPYWLIPLWGNAIIIINEATKLFN